MDRAELPTWVSVAQAADYLGLGRPTLYRWIRTGEIPYIKLPNGWTRIHIVEVEKIKDLLS